MSRRPILCGRARGDREARNGGGRHHAYSGGDKRPPYSNAGDKPCHMAILSGTQRIHGAISERGGSIC
jgi:hypothetical protein